MKLSQICEDKNKVMRRQKFVWVDANGNKDIINIGDREDGTVFVEMKNQKGVAMDLTNVMFNHVSKMGVDKARKLLRDNIKKAFTSNGDVLQVLKRTTGLPGWKKYSPMNESTTADIKHLARAAAKKSLNSEEPEKNPHPTSSFHNRIWKETFNKELTKLEKAEHKARD